MDLGKLGVEELHRITIWLFDVICAIAMENHHAINM
jgi:hypothetical protein